MRENAGKMRTRITMSPDLFYAVRTAPDKCFSELLISGKCDSIHVTQVHIIVSNMDNGIVDLLPSVYALTGCDKTIKIGTKSTAFHAVMKCGFELLYSFRKSEISDQMILSAEKFLVKYFSKSFERNYFDDICFERTIKNRFN